MSESSLVPKNVVFARWELSSAEIEVALSRQLVVAFLGSASSGKDSAIRALFGIDFGQIDPIPGSTDTVRVSALDAQRRVLVVNAPGFGDVRSEVDQRAREILDRVDIVVYVVNAEGGATVDERNDLDEIRRLGRPVLVCLNKIDLIRPHQREEFIHTTLAQLRVRREEAVVTAFDPLPALSPRPIGVDETIRWIHTQLADQGKDLLFAKHLRNKAAACQAVIMAAAKKAAVAGALPIPGADITATTAIQVKLISDIAMIHDKQMDKDMILFVLGEILAGSSKGFVRWGLNALKGAGWIPGGQVAALATSALGATIASGSTYGVGKAAVLFMQRDMKLTGAQLQTVFDAAALAYRDDPEGKAQDVSSFESALDPDAVVIDVPADDP